MQLRTASKKEARRAKAAAAEVSADFYPKILPVAELVALVGRRSGLTRWPPAFCHSSNVHFFDMSRLFRS